MLETRPATNEVVVGSATLLSIDTVVATELTWLAADDQGEVTTLEPQEMGTDNDNCLYAQMRAHGRPIPVTALEISADQQKVTLTLGEMVRGIAAGQSLVVYRGNRVLGHAVIESTRREGAWK